MEAIYIVVTIGLGSPVNLPVFSAGVAAELARFPRFRSIQAAPAVHREDIHHIQGGGGEAVAAEGDEG